MSAPISATDVTHLLTTDRGRSVAAALLLSLALVAAGFCDQVVAATARQAPRSLVAVGQVVTGFGTSGYMFAFSALTFGVAALALRRGHDRWHGISLRIVAERSAFFFAAIALSGVAAQVLKHLFGRARPVLAASDGAFSFHPFSIAASLASFPSGHTTSAFAAAVALGLLSRRLRWWLLGCAALIGASRVLVGAHYPSDVLGGAALGRFAALRVARSFARRGLAFAMDTGRLVPRWSNS